MSDQISLDGVHVHVLEFFDELRLAPNVEIVEAGLPEVGQGIVGAAEAKPELGGAGAASGFAAQAPRDALLQDLHNR